MMGFGYLGSSSSSSSNLSPLAPPFTVDRSNHNKPVSNSNQVSHFNDPSYGVPYTSSWPYSHSSTARQELSADSPRTSTLALHNRGYMVTEAVNLPDTSSWAGLNSNGKHGAEQITSRWSAVYPSPKRVTDSLSYNPSEAKPFYPPYASSVKNDDVPLVTTFSEPCYDLLSTSGLVHGDEVDYTRSLSGLEYNSKQDSVWSGLPVPEGKQLKKDDSFFSEEAAYNSYLNQGSYGTETSSSKRKDDSSLFYYADIIRRANNIEPSMNGKSAFSANNHKLDPSELSKGGSTFRAFPMFSESHPLIQSAEPPEDVWNSHKSYNPIYEKRYHMFDDRMSTTKSSTLVIKPPPASKGLEIENLSSLNISDVLVGGLKGKEQSSGSFLTPNHLSFQIGRTDESTFVVAPLPSSTKEDMSLTNEQLNFEFKARPSLQVPEMSIPSVNTTTTEDVKSSFDHHNPAEDSPCWKGAPTSHFLPFETTEPPSKKLQTDYSFINSSGVGETASGPNIIPVGKLHTVELKAAASNGGGESVHDTIKPNKGHGELTATSDANSQTPTKTYIEMDPEMMYGAKNVNATDVVKSLYNLSDLLLLHCSNDESALKEHEREALDHVIRNLGVCQKKLMMPQQDTVMNETSGTLQLHDDQKPKPKSDVYGKNVEKLLEHASLSAEADPPKDDNMVQAIKKVLDENLECNVELASETLLYKNLWLEAEAELCSLSFRARLERLKRETHNSESKSKSTDDDDDASGAAVKEISSCINASGDPPKVAAASSSTDIDDVEASVMARFNILKRRQDPNPNPVDVQVAATVVAKDNAADVDPWVMDRLNILKRRGELNDNDAQEKQVRDCGDMGPHFQDEDEEEAAMGSGGSDWEHILKDDFSWRLT